MSLFACRAAAPSATNPATGPAAIPAEARASSASRSAPSAPLTTPVADARRFENALVVSVDGLRADALIALPADALPNFRRLERGAWTLNARTDPEWTITLPNHTAMLTGRFVEGADGHGWVENDDPKTGRTLAANRGAYVAGMFDVAHDAGFATALFSGKTKFSLYDTTWDGTNGAADVTGPDDGRDKLDLVRIDLKMTSLVDEVVRWLGESTPKRRLAFVHLAAPDLTGHAFGWDVTPKSRYMTAVRDVDRELGRILDAIEASPALSARTAVILTADHGGGAPLKSHDQPQMWVDYVIPFFAWTGAPANGGAGGFDLYELNAATRRDPGLWQVPRDAGVPPPMRNGDAGNLALTLLGLPTVPGSRIGVRGDVLVEGPESLRTHRLPVPIERGHLPSEAEEAENAKKEPAKTPNGGAGK